MRKVQHTVSECLYLKCGNGLPCALQPRKSWHALLDTDASSVGSHTAAAPAAVPTVQWLPYLHPNGQVMALPARAMSAATSAAAAVDPQTERARDAARHSSSTKQMTDACAVTMGMPSPSSCATVLAAWPLGWCLDDANVQ